MSALCAPDSSMPSANRFPFPEYPNGWFQIANRAELAERQSLTRRYFDRRFVLSAGAGGILALDVTRDRDGMAESWPLTERCGLVFVFHHTESAPPDWSLPAFSTFAEPGWTAMKTTCLEIRSHPQEICENTADVAHLASVHRMAVDPDSEILVETDGPRLGLRIGMKIASRPGAEDASVSIQMWTQNYGPALGVVHLVNPDGTETFSTYAPTPRGNGLLDYRISTALRRPGTPLQIERALDHSHRYQCATVLEDVPIWENKTFHEQPQLSEVDGPIARFREWYSQYY